MEYLTLNNGVKMPLVGFGTFMLGGETCTEAVAAAIKSGYRMIDTAEAYGNEAAVGEAIHQSSVDRRELFLVTEVNFKSYENAKQAVTQSLNRLQTILTCCFSTGLSPTTMRHGAFWKSCMRRAGAGPSAFLTLSRTGSWTYRLQQGGPGGQPD